MPNRLVSTSALKDWLGIASSVTEHDALLAGLEGRCVALIERRTGQYYGPEEADYQEVLNGGHRAVWLSSPPKEGTLAMEYRGTQAGSWEAVAAESYELEGARVVYVGGAELDGYFPPNLPAAGLTRPGRGPVWPGGRRCLRATYTRGYVEDQGPGDVEQLVRYMVALKFRARGREGITRESGVSKSLSYSAEDLAACGFDEVIAPLRRMRL